MSKVYFKKITDFSDKVLINNTCYELLKKMVDEEQLNLEAIVPLKVHFGEKGNSTFLTPENFAGVRKYLSEQNIQSCYIDTNVLYKGSRTKTDDHIKTALEHGFDDLEIVIADGDEENPYHEVLINKKHFDKCKIGTKYANYNNFIILAHFKGHMLAGMGASLKQLAMGFAARGGKLHQHSDSVPCINQDLCISCGICVQKCPVDAISLSDKAFIDSKICVGCASCTAVCPSSAIKNKWDGSNFHEKLAEYAYAAALGKKNIYFNFAFNVTDGCDCVGEKMDIIAPNMGIFISTDPVAIDTATLEMYERVTGNNNFATAKKTLEYAEKIGLGSSEYNLCEI